MDISKEYIVQCEKAEKLRKSWKPEVGDWIVDNGEVRILCRVCSYKGFHQFRSYTYLVPNGGFRSFTDDTITSIIPLFRQDQLQEMVRQPHIRLLWGKLNWVFQKPASDMPAFADQFTSMEQIWLAFVMKEEYNKTWNGDDWVNKI